MMVEVASVFSFHVVVGLWWLHHVVNQKQDVQ